MDIIGISFFLYNFLLVTQERSGYDSQSSCTISSWVDLSWTDHYTYPSSVYLTFLEILWTSERKKRYEVFKVSQDYQEDFTVFTVHQDYALHHITHTVRLLWYLRSNVLNSMRYGSSIHIGLGTLDSAKIIRLSQI